MEFQITRIAKRNSLILLCVGLLLTLIGVLTGYKDHHFSTRLLTNGLIDTFYFFAMGLGALFFLALAYATETGWYAAVKKVIEAVAGFIPYGIGLMGFVLLVITILDGAHIYSCSCVYCFWNGFDAAYLSALLRVYQHLPSELKFTAFQTTNGSDRKKTIVT